MVGYGPFELALLVVIVAVLLHRYLQLIDNIPRP